MIIIGLSLVLNIIFLFLIFFLRSKYASLNAQKMSLEYFLDEYKDKCNKLEQDKIDNVKIIENLSSKTEYQQQLISEFKKLQGEANESVKATLFDLGNQLSKQLIETHKKENQETRDVSEKSMKNAAEKFNKEFERIVNMVGSLSKEVEQSKDTVDVIKNSLLSPSGAGSLAEITLENILKSSGLRVSVDFFMQYNVSGAQEKQRPDAVIFLPDDRIMIVDAKASKFLVDDQDDPSNLAKTMNFHLKTLSSKNYADSVKKSVNENRSVSEVRDVITLMFLPSEHAVEKLVDADNDFMSKAWKENIFPVGPAGLMNMLSFAKFQISEKMMLENHLRIVEEVKNLMNSVGSLTEHSLKLGNSITSVVNHYDKFAASFNYNFLSKAKKLNNMGIGSNIDKKKESLQRLQVVQSKSDIIEIEN